MKSNPILEKRYNADLTHNVEAKYINTISHEQLLSDFYDYLDKYYDLVDMQPGKEFLIKSFIEK